MERIAYKSTETCNIGIKENLFEANTTGSDPAVVEATIKQP